MAGIVLTLFSILWGVVFLRLPRGRRMTSPEPRCAACGYIVYGLPAPTCPECGADLAQPGAVVVGGHRPPGRIIRSIAWSAFCVLAVGIPVFVIWQGFIAPLVPDVAEDTLVLTFAQPTSNAYRSIELRSHTYGLARPSAPRLLYSVSHDAKINLTRSDGTICTAVVDDAVEHFHDATKIDSRESLPLDAAGLTTWLQANGVTGNAQQIDREMANTVGQMRQAILHPGQGIFNNGTTFSSIGSSSGSSSRPQTWVGFVPPALAAIVWIIGLIRIARRSSPAFNAQ